MYNILLLDLDDTILDFQKAERIALAKTIRDFGVEPTQEVLHRYHLINKWHWEQLELGNMTRQQILTGRFEKLFAELDVQADPVEVQASYEKNLAIGHYFLPGAEEAVDQLSRKYRLFLVSNGTASVQKGRMTSANLYRFFETVFVSQEIGYNKPSKAYFDACFARIPDFDPRNALIVGDSLTSDILGGNNAGVDTCWVNPRHLPRRDDIRVDYEIEALNQLPALLEAL